MQHHDHPGHALGGDARPGRRRLGPKAPRRRPRRSPTEGYHSRAVLKEFANGPWRIRIGESRTKLRGRQNAQKRYLIQIAAYNFGLTTRALFGGRHARRDRRPRRRAAATAQFRRPFASRSRGSSGLSASPKPCYATEHLSYDLWGKRCLRAAISAELLEQPEAMMEPDELIHLRREIVRQAARLKDKHTEEKDARVNYACVFCHSAEENNEMRAAAEKLGNVILQAHSGPVFQFNNLQTIAGPLQLLKSRSPDQTRRERGDADFTVSNYARFKKQYVSRPGFKLITLEKAEMIELIDRQFNVRACFSDPPLDKELGLKK